MAENERPLHPVHSALNPFWTHSIEIFWDERMQVDYMFCEKIEKGIQDPMRVGSAKQFILMLGDGNTTATWALAIASVPSGTTKSP